LINGLEKPQSGHIYVNEKPIEEQTKYCAFMPQKDMLFPWWNIEKNVSLPMILAGVPKEEQKARCREVLAQANLLNVLHKYPKDLSGGMRQRVSFVRTLVSGANLLLLDEPFSALDYLTRVDMQEWILHQWEHYQKTILFITHDVEEALFLSKTIYVIQDIPFSTLERIDVPLSYPRKRQDLKNPEILELKELLIEKLRIKWES
jgi:putative hydroxymethylpyrimidine transport system ATP-binding protein